MTDQFVALGCAVLGWCFLLIPAAPYSVLPLAILLALPTFLFAGYASIAGLLGIIEECLTRKTSRKDLLIRGLLSVLALAITVVPFLVTYLRYKSAHPA